MIMASRTLLSAAVVAVIAYPASATGAAAQTTPLYYRLGGYDSILAVVDEAIKNIAADRRINRFFAGATFPACVACSRIRSAWGRADPASTAAAT
jgi:hypothetical protein